MKIYYLIPLLFFSACSTTPKLALRPQPSLPMDDSAVRYPEVVRAYHVGRYVDPNDGLVMHEQHAVYRVEENTRWNFHPGLAEGNLLAPPPRDTAFAPAPVNDAILAEVNSQRLATTQIMMQARTLSAALSQFQTALAQTKTNFQQTMILRATVNDMKQRLDALETAQGQSPTSPISTTNEPLDSLSP
jgi:hypothetical protein